MKGCGDECCLNTGKPDGRAPRFTPTHAPRPASPLVNRRACVLFSPQPQAAEQAGSNSWRRVSVDGLDRLPFCRHAWMHKGEHASPGVFTYNGVFLRHITGARGASLRMKAAQNSSAKTVVGFW